MNATTPGLQVQPFYQDQSGCVLYHGQASVLLPLLPQADLLVTEPYETDVRRKLCAPALYPIDVVRLTMPRVTGWAAYLCPLTSLGQYCLATDDPGMQAGVWHGVRDGAVGGVAVLRGRNTLRWPAGLSRHWEVAANGTALTDLATQLLMTLTQPDDVVVDPWCRDGEVLLAAKRLGRRAIGIDSSTERLGHAARALTQAQLHMRFARQPAAQASLL